jgi:hypothetical protein
VHQELWPSRVRILIPLTECFSVAYPASFLPFAPVCLSSVSDPCSYPFSRLCLPLCDSFPFSIYRLAVRGAAAPPIMGLPIFIVLKANARMNARFHCAVDPLVRRPLLPDTGLLILAFGGRICFY